MTTQRCKSRRIAADDSGPGHGEGVVVQCVEEEQPQQAEGQQEAEGEGVVVEVVDARALHRNQPTNQPTNQPHSPFQSYEFLRGFSNVFNQLRRHGTTID